MRLNALVNSSRRRGDGIYEVYDTRSFNNLFAFMSTLVADYRCRSRSIVAVGCGFISCSECILLFLQVLNNYPLLRRCRAAEEV